MLTDNARNHYSANRMRCVLCRPITGLEGIISTCKSIALGILPRNSRDFDWSDIVANGKRRTFFQTTNYYGPYPDATSDAPERVRSRYTQMDILRYALFNVPLANIECIRVPQVERVALVSFDALRLYRVIFEHILCDIQVKRRHLALWQSCLHK